MRDVKKVKIPIIKKTLKRRMSYYSLRYIFIHWNSKMMKLLIIKKTFELGIGD